MVTINRTDHEARWVPIRPDLTIKPVWGKSTIEGYHLVCFEIVTKYKLTDDVIDGLAKCRVFGVYSRYSVREATPIVDSVPCVTVDKETGEVVSPVGLNYFGEPITARSEYYYFVYHVLVNHDSGD